MSVLPFMSTPPCIFLSKIYAYLQEWKYVYCRHIHGIYSAKLEELVSFCRFGKERERERERERGLSFLEEKSNRRALKVMGVKKIISEF